MKKNILIALFLQCLYISIMAQTNGQVSFELAGLFNEADLITPTDNERYFTTPEGIYSHTQVMDIPASNQANLIHKF